MKSRLVALVCGLLSLSCEHLFHPAGAGPKKTAREVQGFSGPVRSVFTTTAVPLDKDGKWEPGQQKPVSFAAYDVTGNRTEQAVYNFDGALNGKIVFTSDTKGNAIVAIRYGADGAPESRTVSTYDPQGNRTESLSYTAAGALTSRTVFSYDAHGNETAARSYTPSGTPESTTVSTHDARGNLEETAWYRADGTLGGKIVYTRDSMGPLLSSIAYDYDPAGTLQSRTEATYDARGNPTEVVWYSDSGRFKRRETSTYQYDAFGNWTKQTTSKWVTTMGSNSYFEPPVVTYRTLTYYGQGTD